MTSIDHNVTVLPASTAHRLLVLNAAIAHAVRRDLDRLVGVLEQPVTAVRRGALIGHLTFLLDQLRSEHRVQDESIWPAAAARRPDLADLRERAASSHAELREPIAAVVRAAAEWKRAPGHRLAVLAAVHDLSDRLLPVLDQDAELLPLACSVLPAADVVQRERPPARRRWPTGLARRMFWLLDELDPARADQLLQRTPPAAMWILRNGFSGGYNRGAYLMWVGGGTGPSS